MYRVGYPGWKVLARRGFQLKVRVEIARDDEAGVFLASSPDLRGLHVEGETLDELHREMLNSSSKPLSSVNYRRRSTHPHGS